MLQKIAEYQNTNTILEHFEFYDMRQDNYERNLEMKNKQIKNEQNNNINNNENKKKDN